VPLQENIFDDPPKEPAKLSLAEVGWWYGPLPALVGSVEILREADEKTVPIENYNRAHQRLHGMIEFVGRSADGLGIRLKRTGIYENNHFAIEQRVRRLSRAMMDGLVMGLVGISEKRHQAPLHANVGLAAQELRAIGKEFAAIPREAEGIATEIKSEAVPVPQQAKPRDASFTFVFREAPEMKVPRLEITMRSAGAPERPTIIRGRTMARLAWTVIELPDQDHRWVDLAGTGMRNLWWTSDSSSLERIGREIVSRLPAELKHRWQQSAHSVRWSTR